MNHYLETEQAFCEIVALQTLCQLMPMIKSLSTIDSELKHRKRYASWQDKIMLIRYWNTC